MEELIGNDLQCLAGAVDRIHRDALIQGGEGVFFSNCKARE